MDEIGRQPLVVVGATVAVTKLMEWVIKRLTTPLAPTVSNGWGTLVTEFQDENKRLRAEIAELRLANIELRRQAREGGGK